MTDAEPDGDGAAAPVEVRARAAEERAIQLGRELDEMAADLRALDRHVGHLEHDRLVLEIEIAQLRARAAELFADLERDEAVIAELRAELAARQGGSPQHQGGEVASLSSAVAHSLGRIRRGTSHEAVR